MSFHYVLSVGQSTRKNRRRHAPGDNGERIPLLCQVITVSRVCTGIRRRPMYHPFDFFPEGFGLLTCGSGVFFDLVFGCCKVRDTAWPGVDFFTWPVKQEPFGLGEFGDFVGTFVSAGVSRPLLGTELSTVVS